MYRTAVIRVWWRRLCDSVQLYNLTQNISLHTHTKGSTGQNKQGIHLMHKLKHVRITIKVNQAFSDSVSTELTLSAPLKRHSLYGYFIWLQYFVLVFMILCPQRMYCLKLWCPTSLAAPALSRLFCPQHHDSAGQLYHELSHKERSLQQWLGQCWIFHWNMLVGTQMLLIKY